MRATTGAVLQDIDAALGGYVTWQGSEDSADSTADDLYDETTYYYTGITEICSALSFDADGYFSPVEPGFTGTCVLLERWIDESGEDGFLEELARGSYEDCQSVANA
jgi:hypothetical protein